MKYTIVDFAEHAGIHSGLPVLQVLVALVDSQFTEKDGPGDQLLAKIKPHFPTYPAMLVSVEDNGFRAYAPFQTHKLLAYLQIPVLEWYELDLNAPLPEEDPPF